MQDLEILQNKLKSNSVLNFTIELNNNQKQPSLDIKIDTTNNISIQKHIEKKLIQVFVLMETVFVMKNTKAALSITI